MKYVVLDFETESEADLKKVGAWSYAEHPSTKIICIGFSEDGKEPRNATNYEDSHDLNLLAADPAVIFVAHNAGFEKAVWRSILVRKMGWNDVPNERWHDTQAVAAIRGVPLGLEKVAPAVGLKHHKDPEGKRLLKDPSPENLPRIQQYCNQDVRTENELLWRLGGYHEERENYLLDQRINERGVALDAAYIRRALDLIPIAAAPKIEEFKELTGGLVPTQTEAFKVWLAAQGLPLESLNKEELDELPDFCVPDNCIRPLALRRVLGGATVRKFKAMLNCIASDGRAHGALQYHGATTGRWSGRLFQPQNFPRDTLKEGEAFVQAVLAGDLAFIEAMWGDLFDCLRKAARLAVIASPNNLLTSGDLMQIEARIVLAYAGQYDFLDRMAAGEDPYCLAGAYPAGKPIDKKLAKLGDAFHAYWRQVGKAIFLGCGFGMGWETFLERYLRPGEDDLAKLGVHSYRKQIAPKVPKLWAALEVASTTAVEFPGRAVETNGVEYKMDGDWLTARLPSGRRLWYPFPRLEDTVTPWGEDKLSWSHMTVKKAQWVRRTTYGGLHAENVTQGLARDVLLHGMKNCEKAGLPVVLTIHDSIIGDHAKSVDGEKILYQCMTDRPRYLEEMRCPLGTEISKPAQRYAK